MEHWTEHTVLKPEDLAKYLGVNKRTLLQMVRDGRAPQPIGGRKPPMRWRWGAVKKWYEAMETLYGVGCVSKTVQEATKKDESMQNSSGDDLPTGKKGK